MAAPCFFVPIPIPDIPFYGHITGFSGKNVIRTRPCSFKRLVFEI